MTEQLASSSAPSFGPMVIGLLGGLAFFLFGMEQMTDALKFIAGDGIRKLLGRLTTNRFTGALTGAFVTAVIQSSSVTAVLCVGFISAGIMTLTQSVGVIMGANIGTTITAQIIAFKVTKYALLIIIVGFAALFTMKQEKIRQLGAVLMGLGLIFFGMELMSDAMKPLRAYAPFIDLMQQMKNPFLGILIGMVFTALVQSSSATTGIVIVLAGQGFISLEAGIALVFGANIGTCVTALLAAIGKPREAFQAAIVHVLFNVAGVVLWVGFLRQLAGLVRSVSPASLDLAGAARLAAEAPRQIANAHTIFNVANTVLFIGFATPVARLVRRLVPDRPPVAPTHPELQFLDDIYLETPGMALDRVRLELNHLGELVLAMIRRGIPAAMQGTEQELAKVAQANDDVDALHGDIIMYIGRVAQQDVTADQTARMGMLLSVANDIENLGDVLGVNFVGLGVDRLRQRVEIGEAVIEVLTPLMRAVVQAFESTLEALPEENVEGAMEVLGMQSEIQHLAAAATRHISGEVMGAAQDRIARFRVATDLVELMNRVYDFASRIASAIAEPDEEEVEASG